MTLILRAFTLYDYSNNTALVSVQWALKFHYGLGG